MARSAASFDAAFENVGKLEFHLAPPILGRKDAQGAPVKTTFGPWMMSAYRVLASLKFLRGGALDIFGKTTGSAAGTSAACRLRETARRGRSRPQRNDAAARRAACFHPGKDPRLRPREGQPHRQGEGRRGEAFSQIPRAECADVGGVGISVFYVIATKSELQARSIRP